MPFAPSLPIPPVKNDIYPVLCGMIFMRMIAAVRLGTEPTAAVPGRMP